MRRAPLALLLVGLAGCGAAEDLDPDVVAQAADKTTAAGTARFSVTLGVQGDALRAGGFIDMQGERVRMTAAVPGGGRLDEILVERTLYVRFPQAISGDLADGKEWVKIDLDRVLRRNGIDLGALQDATTSDPSAQLAQLRGAGDVKRLGTQTVRGTATTHYRAVVDLRKAAARAPAAKRAAVRRSIDRVIRLSGQRRIPTEVWLDARDRLRRMKVTQRIDGQQMGYTIDLYDFGARDEVSAPPASQTKDLTELAARQAP